MPAKGRAARRVFGMLRIPELREEGVFLVLSFTREL
jgi:hypothetical protein